MAKNFNDLADRIKGTWDSDTHRVYEAASVDFSAEVEEQVRLGEALARARKDNSLTQSALSEVTGVQQAEISRIERGIGNPTALTLQRLSKALGRRIMLLPATSDAQ